ncbi:grwd1 [Scenedesmus sp. PABB004]|nr:grwd1 [Scenedesmus sp. PABB004]
MAVDDAGGPSAPPAVWRPGIDPVGEDEELDYDPTAYDCLHKFSLEWPCLSFDLLRDELGGPRSTFPHTVFMVAGTQASSARANYLAVLKLADLGQGRHGKRAVKPRGSDDESSDESESDEGSDAMDDSDDDDAREPPPRMHHRLVSQPCGINRVRACQARPGLVAVWGDNGSVRVLDVAAQLAALAGEVEVDGKAGAKGSVNPLQAQPHAAEGFALDWSPLKPGRLASGDCKKHIHVWEPAEGGKWAVSPAYNGHAGSVEDLQWSPSEESVFASCSTDRTIAIFDTRERGRAMLQVPAAECDVNVLSWNRLVTYMLASGADDGGLRVWDLRSFKAGGHVSQFNFHRGAVTSVEWSPYEGSMLATTGADNAALVWDLALERDPEEEAALAPEGNAVPAEALPSQLLFAPGPRPPSASYLCLTFPFTRNAALRGQYQRFSSPFLRAGLLLEDLDAFAADVAVRHLGGLPPGTTVVTASLDKVAFATSRSPAGGGAAAAAAQGGAPQQPLPPGWGAQREQQQHQQRVVATPGGDAALATDEGGDDVSDILQTPLTIGADLRVAGCVAWAGRTSMEVLVEVSTEAPRPSGDGGPPRWVHRAVAHFLMVLRPTGDSTGAPDVPRVAPQTELERLHFDAAEERAAVSRAKRKSGRLMGSEPEGDEVRLVYDLAEAQLRRQLARQEAEAEAARGGDPPLQRRASVTSGAMLAPAHGDGALAPVPMSATVRSLVALMHIQDRNNAGAIFGGHILRLASELAYSTAVLHAGRHCEAVALGNVTFLQPVPVGCVLELRAKVVFTDGPLMRVNVVATKHAQLVERPAQLHASVSNDFSFTLLAVGAHGLRPVEPETLRECVQWLKARRDHAADGFVVPPALLREGVEHMLLASAAPPPADSDAA